MIDAIREAAFVVLKDNESSPFFCPCDSILCRFEVLYFLHSLEDQRVISREKEVLSMRENNTGFRI